MPDFYRIGIALSLTSNVSQVMQAVARDMLYVHTHVNALQSAFSRLGLAVSGAFAMFTGTAALRGVEHLVDKTKSYYDELARLKNLGMSMPEIDAYRSTAWGAIGQTRGVTLTQSMNAAGAAFSMTRDFGETNALIGPITRFLGASQIYGKTTPDDTLKLLRSSDLLSRFTNPQTGAFDAGRFGGFLDLLSKGMAGTHGAFNLRTSLALGQQAGAATMGLSDQGLVTMMVMSQMMGGLRAGTAFTSLYQQFAGGQMRAPQIRELEFLGLLDPSEVLGERGGGGGAGGPRLHGAPRGFGRGARGSGFGGMSISDAASKRLSGMWGTDTLEGMSEVIRRLEERGVTDPADIQQHTFRLGGRQTTQRFMALQGRSREQMRRERWGISQGPGTDDMYANAEDMSVTKNLTDLSAAWNDLLIVVGGEKTPFYLEYIKKLTDYIINFTTALRTVNPETLQALGKGFIVMGTALVGAGAVAIIAALGPAGWFILGMGALAAIFVKDWGAAFNSVVKGFRAVMDTIDVIANWLDSRIPKGGHFPWEMYPDKPEPNPMYKAPGYSPPSGGGFNFGDWWRGQTTPKAKPMSLSALGNSITGPKIPLTGVEGHPTFGTGGGANFMTGALPGGGDLTRITTAAGAMTAYGPAAADMGGFVDDLMAAGAPIHSIGSYNKRHIAGSSRWSQHAYGTAIDIEQSARNVVSPAFLAWANSHPSQLREAMRRRHMLSGGDWHGKSGPDFGHFEWGGPGETGYAKGSRAIPPNKDAGTTIQHQTYLDGRQIAESVTRHQVRGMGQGMTSGSRISDPTATRPQAV